MAKDGARKNDCEAAARLLEDVRREHPHLKLVEDGLASNGPHFLKGLDLRLGAKPGDHKFLFEWVNSAPSGLQIYFCKNPISYLISRFRL